MFAARRRPLVMHYRVNAGRVARGSWVVDPVQGGGRLIGEACHMLDLMQHLAATPITSVFAQPLATPDSVADDVVLSLVFGDGSIGSLTYASDGDRSLSKERLEVIGDGRAAVLDDFRALDTFVGGRKHSSGGGLASGRQDKGHAAELAAFVDAVRYGKPSPIDPESAAHTTRVTFAAVESARSGVPVQL
jgi:predicted dehydrogenase